MVFARNIESYAGDVEPPATKFHAVNTFREEDQSKARNVGLNDAASSKPPGKLAADTPPLKTRNAPMILGTWNVRTLLQAGKLDNLIQEIEEIGMDIIGIAETRWTGSDKIVKDNHTFIYYSRGEKHEYGVDILMKNRIAKALAMKEL